MIDLHFVATPNGHKLSIMLLETGLEHRIIRYNMLAGEHRTAEFRAISPNGRAPAIVDHDPIGGGEPYPMFETGAILIYLAEKSGRFLPVEPRARYRAHQWLMWQMSGLGPMHGQAHHFVRYAPDPPPYALNRYMTEARRLMGVMDTRLAWPRRLTWPARTIRSPTSRAGPGSARRGRSTSTWPTTPSSTTGSNGWANGRRCATAPMFRPTTTSSRPGRARWR
jgi:glutathione S-transferase